LELLLIFRCART